MKASFPVKAKLADGCKVGLATGINAVHAGGSLDLEYGRRLELELFHKAIHAIADRRHRAELARIAATPPKPLSKAAQVRVRKAAKVPMIPVSRLHRHSRKCREAIAAGQGMGHNDAGNTFTAANGKCYRRLPAGTVKAFMGRKPKHGVNPSTSELETHTPAYWYAVERCTVMGLAIPVFPLPRWLAAELKREQLEARRREKAEKARSEGVA